NASLAEERWKKRLGMDLESLCEPYAVRVTCSVVVGPTHPNCSIIYGSTGVTNFDQLAEILTGYEITGA
ncbi:NADH dehydrogenase subunit 2, partial [Trifolium medium]|nr:NADH dehydrogenase subunit 2 [Trifolium medium]